MEEKARKKSDGKWKQSLHKWNLAPSHFPQVQFQDNPSDGAVFVLQYVENFLKVSQKSERLEKKKQKKTAL